MVSQSLTQYLQSGGKLAPIADEFEALTGKRPSPATIWRITTKGNGRAGVLPSLVVLGQRMTVRQALVDWLQRGSEPAHAADADDSGERDEATDRRLRAAGLLE